MAKKNLDSAVAEPGLEASTVELGTDYTPVGPNVEKVLQKYIIPKYPEMWIAWVRKEDTRFKRLGWKMLAFSSGGDDVEEVKTVEEAERSHSNVLCWMPLKMHQEFTKDENANRLRFNKMVRREGSKEQAQAFNRTIGIPGVQASPLKTTD